MQLIHRITRTGTAVALLATLASCSSAGNIGSILGSVLGSATGQGGGNQVSGYVQSVDTRRQQIYLQQQNGQSVALSFDGNTQVAYQNRSYPVTSLERGDAVTARIVSSNNSNGYYTDLIQVDQSVSSSNGSGASGTVQSFQGTVRGMNSNGDLISVDLSSGSNVTVSLPNQLSQNDYNRFRNLRNGDQIRFYGVVLSNREIQLRQFY